jgi:hypothetical protein
MDTCKKITHFFENKNNIIKIIILLIVLFIIYRIFTTEIKNTNNQNKYNNKNTTVEHFESMSMPYYGNVITLSNDNNEPIESNNQYIFNLNKSYRIDSLVFKFNNSQDIDFIDIKYKYGSNNYKYLKSSVNDNHNEPTQFTLDNNKVIINNILNEHNVLVYTSELILTITYINNTSTNNLVSYGIFGGDRKLLTKTNYNNKTINENISNIHIEKPKDELIQYNETNNITKYTYNINNENDNMKIYCIKIKYTKNLVYSNINNIDIKIEYENTLFPLDNFKIKKTYKIRCDKYSLNKDNNNNSTYIILNEPIIANKLMISANTRNDLELLNIIINGNNPTSEDITEYKRTVNLLTNKNNSLETSICPSINDLVEKQNKTQEICDNLEYQDKIKSEKIRLERNKQYLLKLKNQQEQISDLNKVILELEDKREARATTADQIRVLQYQKQKGDASTIRDLTNQRLESQDNNKLFMDLNLNYTN